MIASSSGRVMRMSPAHRPAGRELWSPSGRRAVPLPGGTSSRSRVRAFRAEVPVLPGATPAALSTWVSRGPVDRFPGEVGVAHRLSDEGHPLPASMSVSVVPVAPRSQIATTPDRAARGRRAGRPARPHSPAPAGRRTIRGCCRARPMASTAAGRQCAGVPPSPPRARAIPAVRCGQGRRARRPVGPHRCAPIRRERRCRRDPDAVHEVVDQPTGPRDRRRSGHSAVPVTAASVAGIRWRAEAGELEEFISPVVSVPARPALPTGWCRDRG